jgi:hypothetical protein
MDDQMKVNQPQIVFIGGSGRCGTNVSKTIFSLHPEVATLPFEYRFIIDPDGLVDFYRSYSATWSPYLADRRLKRLERLLKTVARESLFHRLTGNLLRGLDRNGKILSPRRYHGWNLEAHLPDFKKFSRELMAELREFSFSGCWVGTESYFYRPQIYHAGPTVAGELSQILGRFICRVISNLLLNYDKKFYVEDNTWNILFARELQELMPQAKLLHVFRDPRDVVASFIRQRWCPSDVKQAALFYRSIMSHWFIVRTELPPDFYLEYSLESLVKNPEQILRQICEFSKIPYHSVLLSTDLSKSNSGRWRRDFSKTEQKTVTGLLEDIIQKLGYA